MNIVTCILSKGTIIVINIVATIVVCFTFFGKVLAHVFFYGSCCPSNVMCWNGWKFWCAVSKVSFALRMLHVLFYFLEGLLHSFWAVVALPTFLCCRNCEVWCVVSKVVSEWSMPCGGFGP